MANKGKIIILSGPSGVGKGSVNRLLMDDSSLKLEFSVSMTTRAPRDGEVNGVNYFFVSRETFEKAIKNNELIEYAEFIGNYYGTPRKYVYDKINEGKNVMLEIEVSGATKVIQNENPDDLITIFLMPPNLDQLKQRLIGRGTEAPEVVKQRLDKALLEIPLKHSYKYILINDSLENSSAKIRDILVKENAVDTMELSSYFILQSKIKQVLKEKYSFFIDNWEGIINAKKQLNMSNDETYAYFARIIAEESYKEILRSRNLNSIRDPEFITYIIEHVLLDTDFIEKVGK